MSPGRLSLWATELLNTAGIVAALANSYSETIEVASAAQSKISRLETLLLEVSFNTPHYRLLPRSFITNSRPS
jgi:hypothetical protein